MKRLTHRRLVLMVAVAIVIWSAYALRKLGWDSDFGRPWRVDIEASVSKIDRVPDRFRNRFASVDEYKNHVRNLARGLTLTIYENGTASLGRGGSRSTAMKWRKDDDFDYWLNTQGSWLFPVAGVGHGFERVSSHTARLKFQLEWDENVATRQYLVLRH
jgi:hypothetical protein